MALMGVNLWQSDFIAYSLQEKAPTVRCCRSLLYITKINSVVRHTHSLKLRWSAAFSLVLAYIFVIMVISQQALRYRALISNSWSFPWGYWVSRFGPLGPLGGCSGPAGVIIPTMGFLANTGPFWRLWAGFPVHLRADLRGMWPGSARSVISNVIIFLFRSSSSSLALIDSFRYTLSGFCSSLTL